MAFVQQHPRQQRREREYTPDGVSQSKATSNDAAAAQDWSIVFPGRSRHAQDDDAQDDTLTLTLPPLHDGTGRFTTEEVASTQSSNQDVLSPRSEEVFPDSEFDGTEGDADEELGFGSGSDFESDAVASSVPSKSSASRLRSSPSRTRRRPSRLSQVDFGSDQEDTGPSWSFLDRSQAQIQESNSASTQLFSSTRSSRLDTREQGPPAAVFTSDEEPTTADQEQDFAADLASSNLAHSAGLGHYNSPSALLRRPKRRHRLSATGRSSKRSNTSQSVDHHGRILRNDGATTPRSATAAATDGSSTTRSSSKTSRVIGSILRKVFDLEPDVLDSVLGTDDARYRPTTRNRPGFSHEHPEATMFAWNATTELEDELLEQDEHERVDLDDDDKVAAMLSSSPLFDNAMPVRGEDTQQPPDAKLTEAALLQRRSSSTIPNRMMEPTTMEALSAFMTTVGMPVPMPFRLLGAIFGWSSIWTPRADTSRTETDDARKWAEEERKYRYERLLSAQQAKAWSRRYRGILFANVVDEDQHSLDVPEFWRGEEHPAIAN